MSTLAIRLLGPPRFVRDGAPAGRIPAKGVAMVLWLAIRRMPQPRGRLLNLLWPESLPQAARKNMRNILWEIGEALGNVVL